MKYEFKFEFFESPPAPLPGSPLYYLPTADSLDPKLANNQTSTITAQNLSPKTRTQVKLAFSSQQQRAKFMYSNDLVKLSDKSKNIYLVTNERNEIHMVKLAKNTCTCFSSTNCAHILACRLFNGESIELKTKDLTQSLSKLKGNQKGNKAAGRKYPDNIPQSEPAINCFVCKTDKRVGFPGEFCCDKFIHNKCKIYHKC